MTRKHLKILTTSKLRELVEIEKDPRNITAINNELAIREHQKSLSQITTSDILKSWTR